VPTDWYAPYARYKQQLKWQWLFVSERILSGFFITTSKVLPGCCCSARGRTGLRAADRPSANRAAPKRCKSPGGGVDPVAITYPLLAQVKPNSIAQPVQPPETFD